jgi:hypothetical protein
MIGALSFAANARASVSSVTASAPTAYRYIIATPHIDTVCSFTCEYYYNPVTETDVSGNQNQKLFLIAGVSSSLGGSFTVAIF